MHSPYDRMYEHAMVQAEEIASRGGEAQPAAVDVIKDEAVASALQQHIDKYQSLDIVCLNAGVMEPGRPSVYLDLSLLAAFLQLKACPAWLHNLQHNNVWKVLKAGRGFAD